MTEKIVTPKFRVSFPHVMEPAFNMQKTAKKFSVVMLFPKDTDLSKLIDIVNQAKQEKWGDKPPKGLRSPFRDGNEKEYEGYEDAIYASASSQESSRPGLINERKEKIIDPNEFYAGCYAIATIKAYAYDTAGNKGVAFALHNVMKMDDGESLTGRTSAENDFEAIETSIPATSNPSLLNPLDI